MSVNLQDAPEQKEFGGIIPDGSFVKVTLSIRPGGHSEPPSGDPTQDMLDGDLFYASKSSDAIMLDTEMTVIDVQWKHQKIWQYFTVGGGSLNADGSSKGWLISKAAFRAMIDCACGLDPKDDTPRARDMRVMRGFKDLDGIEFWARVGIQKGGKRDGGGGGDDYPDKNTIAHIVTPDEPEWKMLIEGKEVEPQPRGVRGGSGGGKAAAADPGKPAWQREAAPAAASVQQTRQTPAGPSWANGGGQVAPAIVPVTQTAPAPAAVPVAQTTPAPTPEQAPPPPAANVSAGPAWLRK